MRTRQLWAAWRDRAALSAHPAPAEPSVTEAMVEAAFVQLYGGPSDYIFDSGNKYGRAGRSAREAALSKVRAALLAAMAKVAK